MVAAHNITEDGKSGADGSFGHQKAVKKRTKRVPTNGEFVTVRTGVEPGTLLKHASGRNDDGLNPKETAMTPTICSENDCFSARCRSMDALEEIFNVPEQLIRVRASMPRVLLASQSPRRRRLLDEHGIEHGAIASGVDDGLLMRGGVTPSEWVAALAYFKAAAARERISPADYLPGEVVILGADTVVRKGDRVIGQPSDDADAARIIRTLRNGEHDVLTGVAFVDAASGKRDMWVDRARVRVGDVGDDRIAEYVGSGAWRGKAGAYNLSERIADGWPIEYEGDPGTIMGLPMQRLGERLIAFRERCGAF